MTTLCQYSPPRPAYVPLRALWKGTRLPNHHPVSPSKNKTHRSYFWLFSSFHLWHIIYLHVLQNIFQIVLFLPVSASVVLVQATPCLLDSGSSFLTDLPAFIPVPFQSIIYTAIRIIFLNQTRSCYSMALRFQWFLITFSLKYKRFKVHIIKREGRVHLILPSPRERDAGQRSKAEYVVWVYRPVEKPCSLISLLSNKSSIKVT